MTPAGFELGTNGGFQAPRSPELATPPVVKVVVRRLAGMVESEVGWSHVCMDMHGIVCPFLDIGSPFDDLGWDDSLL